MAVTQKSAPVASPVAGIAFGHAIPAALHHVIFLCGARLLPRRLQLWAVCDSMTKATTVGTSFDTTNLLHVVTRCRRVQLLQERRHVLTGLQQQRLEVQEDRLLLIFVDEGRGNACAATAPSPADTVHVVLDLLGHVKVDHVLDGREVQTLGGHVRAYEHVLRALLEGLDGLMPLLLVQAAVDRHDLDALQQQVLVHVVHVRLVLAENQHGWRGLLQALEQVDQLRLLLDVLDLLDDVQVCRTCTAHVDDDRVHQCGLGKVLDLPWHGGTEQERLALTAKVVERVADFLLKAEVNHPVSLVHHQVLALNQRQSFFGEKVVQPARSRNHHVDATPEGHHLGPSAQTADGENGAQLGELWVVLSELVSVKLQDLVGLVSQLAGRGDDQAVGPLTASDLGPELLLQSTEDHGHTEHERLAAAREGDTDHVPAAQRNRKPLHLDLRGSLDALLLQTLQQPLRQPHLFKPLDWRRHVLSVHLDEEFVTNCLALLLGHVAVLLERPPAAYGLHSLRVDDALGPLPDRHQGRAKLQLHLLEHPLLFILDSSQFGLITGVPVLLLLLPELLGNGEK
mmetsp:Transcript_48848/g.139856  ORF Transcript_48848/g.139856 Transcript_48848/m.139856 type:complete len:568 (+) Transcript_48848:151-1854(+)